MGTRRNKINGNEFPKRFIAESRRCSNEERIPGKGKETEKARCDRGAKIQFETSDERADSDAAKGDRVFIVKTSMASQAGGLERSGIYPR